MLWRALKHVERGFYIDVGANDPMIDSVTKAFYDVGWNGVNIEPLRSHHLDLVRDRPNDINLMCAAGSTAAANVMALHSSTGHQVTALTAPMRTLADICTEFVKGDIHFLKIDVEGFEQAVLEGADFLRFRPWIVVIESTGPNSSIEVHDQWEPLLLNFGYSSAYADGLNRYYIANEHPELVAAFRHPPNVFDNFTTFSHVKSQIDAQQANERAEHAVAQVEETSKRSGYAVAQAQQAEAKAQQAEAKAQQAEASLMAILNSTSWTFSAPIRMVGKLMDSTRANFLSRLAPLTINKLAMFFRWQATPRLAEEIKSDYAHRQLSTIAVDLTPILPGGENGGAKIFVVELLRQLAEMVPLTNFVLLTQAASHEELSVLDRTNMRRQVVIGPVTASSPRLLLKGLASSLLPLFPNLLRRLVSRVGYKLNTQLKRSGSGAMLRGMRVDLLFCPFTAPTYFEFGIPTVCTLYDLQYKTYPEFFSSDDVAHRDRTFIEACRRATALTAISNYSRDTAIVHGNFDPTKIRTIYLRMAQRIVPEAEHDKAILSRLGLSPRQYLMYPANFWKHKNHEMLLTAFGIACHGELPGNIKLVCTGAPGARQDCLRDAARDMNMGERILFPGYLPDAELAALMVNCSGVVFPSLYEGFGLPIIEAMAAGVPVACSNITSFPEVAADAAILFDPRVPTQIAKAMVSMVENGALCGRIIEAGKQRAVEFSDAERMAIEYWELFQFALSAEHKHENLLTGIYPDGWVGPSLNLRIAPAKSAQMLKITFFAPEWLAKSQITIQAIRGGKPQGVSFVFNRGTKAIFSLPIESMGGCFELKISPSFVPAHYGHSDDQRELSVQLQKCSVIRADSGSIELFSEVRDA